MADARNYKFISTWKGKFTKWDYKLEIILPPIGSAFGLDLVNPTEIPLPPGAVVLQSQDIEYADFHAKMPNVPTQKIQVDFDLLNSVDLLPLKNAFFEESPNLTALQTYVPGYPTLAAEVLAGIVFKLFIKFNGDDLNVPIPWRAVRTTIYQSDGKIKIDMKHKVNSFDAIDINKVITGAFPWQSLKSYTPPTEYRVMRYLDFKWSEETNPREVQSSEFREGAYNSWMYFSPLSEIHAVIENTCVNIKTVLMRESSAFDLTIYLPVLYKQLYDGTGDKGAVIAHEDKLVLTKIGSLDADGVEIFVSGLFYPANKYSFYGRYPNGVWDYLQELAEFSIHQYRVEDEGVGCEILNYNTLVLNLTQENIINCEINSERYKTITSSMYEVKTDENTGGDLEKYEVALGGGRNEAQWTTPMVYNNVPPNVKSETRDAYIRYYNKQKLCNFYYLEGTAIIRVHEWAKFGLEFDETARSSDDYNVFFAVPRTGGIYSFDHPERAALVCQTESGMPRILAKTYAALLKNGFDKLEIEITLNSHVEFVEGGGGTGFVWNMPKNMSEIFQVNLDELLGVTYTKNNWKLIKSEIDFLNEKVKATLINLTL